MTPPIDLRSDLNAEDDNGENWGLLRHAVAPERVMPGAVLVAGTPRHWSVVRITAVDPDGQVHFVQLDEDDPAARQLLAPWPEKGAHQDRVSSAAERMVSAHAEAFDRLGR